MSLNLRAQLQQDSAVFRATVIDPYLKASSLIDKKQASKYLLASFATPRTAKQDYQYLSQINKQFVDAVKQFADTHYTSNLRAGSGLTPAGTTFYNNLGHELTSSKNWKH